MRQIIEIPKILSLKLIRVYQHTLSLDHGIFKELFPQGYCKFNPTCSEYSYQAIKKYGIIIGGAKGIYRIIRCNPFSKGGDDLLK